MNSNDFQEAKIKLNLNIGDRIKVKIDTEEEIYISFILLDCEAMRGEYSEYISIGEIENNPGCWQEGEGCGLIHIEKIICKV